ncbi:LysR family transcriptional regulator [Pseudorhodoferax sp.]|jgi:DNA-binding transcriptional LysR family regulator|uniref:LysR family transcriptional regulator n=1 Tax=Pseudorhodoferax sp. TaxID=1993553 RepID=UPI001B7C0E42|nr:LysR substrate-binding domain-containing protein [Pseudorhodoferax sp.]MBP8145955.1 LysR family transcriptional regulator [Inhella sp.]
MRLRHIEVFHAIMQAGSVSGAAQLLHISQPAVTKVLQHAELQLGLQLFDRVRGKLVPTPEAQRLFIETEKLNRDLVAIRRLAAQLRSGGEELLRVLATPALGASVLPAAVTAWAKAFPAGRCQLATHHTREIVSSLLLGEADLGLSLQDPRHPGIHAEVLASGDMMALCPRGSPESRQDGALRLADLKSELIAMAEDDPLGHQLANAFAAQDLHPVPRISVQTYQLARSLVESGLGLSIVDPFTAAGCVAAGAAGERGPVVVRRVEPAISVPLVLLVPASRPLTQAGRRFVKLLTDSTRASLARLA